MNKTKKLWFLTLGTGLVIGFSFQGNATDVDIGYTNTLGDNSAYSIKFTEGSIDDKKFIYYTLNPDGTVNTSYVNYNWNVKDDLFGDSALSSTPNLYFQWQLDPDKNNLKLVKVTPTSPKYGVNYNVMAYIKPSENVREIITSNTTSINQSFSGLTSELGSAINISGVYTIGSITGDFIANTTSILVSSNAYGGSFYNKSGIITSIAGSFIGNTTTGTNIAGGALINIGGGKITNINADFIGNGITPTADGGGGALVNRDNSATTIDTITGDFIGNYIIAGDDGRGGAIYNMSSALISSIKGNFVGNYLNTKSIAHGGAIGNVAYVTSINGGTITKIEGDFINNTAFSSYINAAASAAGGAIYNYKGTIDNIIGDFIGNSAIIIPTTMGNASNDRALGGAIVHTVQIAPIKSITGDFINNLASATGGNARGGAIYNTSTISLIKGDFIGNAVASNSADKKDYAYGGAIANISGTITVQDANFYNNNAKGSTSQGGAIFNSGTMTIKNSVFDSNSATPTANNARGGAIENAGIMNIYDTSFYDNYGVTGASAYGGAFYNTKTLNLYAENKDIVFSGNYVTDKNGTREIAIENSLTGIVNFNSTGTNKIMFYDLINDGTLNLNSGTLGLGTGSGITKATLNASGGTKISLIDNELNDVTISNLVISGGDINYGIDVNLQTAKADTITLSSLTTNSNEISINEINIIEDKEGTTIVELSSDQKTRNAITLAADEIITSTNIYLYNAVSYTKATGELEIFQTGKANLKYMVGLNADDKIYNLEEIELVEENLGNLQGDKLTINGNNFTVKTNGDYSGIRVGANQTLNIYNVSDYTGFNNTSNGGSLNNIGGTIDINGTTFTDNTATTFGGVLYQSGGTTSLTNTTFGGLLSDGTINTSGKNTATNGGALYILDGTITASGTNFYGNIANALGGAVYNRGISSFTNATFLGNSSTNGGGAIYQATASLVITNSTFGMLNSDSTVDLSKGNSSSQGGVIFVSYGNVNIEDTNFYGNSATSSGGAIYNESNTTIIDGDFIGNKATGIDSKGGAIYNSSTGVLNIKAIDEDVIFSGNTANGVSNAIFNDAGGVINITSTNDYVNNIHHQIIFYDDLLGSGTYNILQGSILLQGANFDSSSTINISRGAGISTINNRIQTTTLGKVYVDGYANMGLDVNLADQTADTINYGGLFLETGELLVLSELNIMNAPTTGEDIEIIITDKEAFKDKITLANNVVIRNPQYIDGFLIDYDFSGVNGVLKLTYSSLNNAIASTLNKKAFSFDIANSAKATANLGAMQGETLSITSNGGIILGENYAGASITTGQYLSITDVSEISGFSDAFLTNNGGSIEIKTENIMNMTIDDEIVNNSGNIYISAEEGEAISIGALSGAGNTYATGDITFDSITNGLISINSGDIIFDGTITGATITQSTDTTIFNDTITNTAFTQTTGTSTINADVTNSTIDLKSGTLNLNANFDNTSNFNATSGTLSTIGNGDLTSTLGNINLNGDINWHLDVDLASASADKLNANSIIANNNNILIQTINILTDTNLSYVEVLLSDNQDIRNVITLGDELITLEAGLTGNYDAISYDKVTGLLKIDNLDVVTFKEVVNATETERFYNFSADESVTETLGDMGGEKLTVEGNNFSIIATGSNTSGINVANNTVLTLNNITNYTGFNSPTSGGLFNSGTINIYAQSTSTTFSNNLLYSVYNEGGVLNLSASSSQSITFNDNINGILGIININEGEVNFNGTVAGNSINLNASGIMKVGNSGSLGETTLVGNGGYLNLIDGDTKETNFFNITLNDKTNIGLDVDLSMAIADTITAETEIIIKERTTKFLDLTNINITTDAREVPVSVNIADNEIRSTIQISSGINITNTPATEDYENGYFIEYDSSIGNLIFSYSTLQYAITSSVSKKVYSLNGDLIIDTALPTLNGDSLTIDGQSHTITGNAGIAGFDIITGKTLNFREVTLDGFSGDIAIQNNGTLNLYDDVILKSAISGTGDINIEGLNVTLDTDMSGFAGTTTLNNGSIKIGASTGIDASGNTNFFGGTFIVDTATGAFIDTQNGKKDTLSTSGWDLRTDLNVHVDVDLASKWSDTFIDTDTLANDIIISGISIITDKENKTTVDMNNETSGVIFDKSLVIAYSPIYKYSVDSSMFDTNGEVTFTRLNDFSPSTYTGQVGGQVNYLSNINIFKEVFADLGAITDSGATSLASGDTINGFENSWVRTFGNDETVKLGHGIDVDNQTFGTILGKNSPINVSNDNVKSIYSLYFGYLGSSQEYTDVSVNQNGFVMGAKASFIKDDLFAAASFNFGPSFADASNIFGDEDYTMFSAGIAGKVGYTYRLYDGEYILQPSLMAAYNYIYTGSYTNSADYRIHAQDINALLISPELKLIKNLESDWQAYGAIAYNISVVDASKLKINEIFLPTATVKPYAEFKIGLQKPMKNIYDTMIELSTTAGGKKGFGFEFSINWDF